LDTIPATVPYLFPDQGLIDKWRHELGEAAEFRVGVAWQGDPRQPQDRYRSLSVQYFARLADLPKVRLYSLQFGAGREQLAKLTTSSAIVDFGERLGDFNSTAALIRNLDLVITCDSVPAHLAGGLGTPVWVALPRVADWRWLLDRGDSPWYPTMRLYRQRRRGDWAEVFARIASDLSKLVRKTS
jgi:hypothetical protein